MRDMVIINFVAASPNPTVAEWGPARVAGILDSMREFLDTGRYVGHLPDVTTLGSGPPAG